MSGLKNYIRYSGSIRKYFYKILKALDRIPPYRAVYHKAIVAKAARASDFPLELSIETINLCNARCTICSHPDMQRKKGKMPEAMVYSLIDQAAGRVARLFLSGFGEPLLDNRLRDFIKYAQDKGIDNISIVTNGYLLKPELAESLIDAGLNEIIISIDGFTRETYEQIRLGLKFDTLIENIRGLSSLANRRRTDISISCVELVHNRNEKKQARTLFGGVVDSIYFRQAQGWTRRYGQELAGYTPHFELNKIPCRYLWDSATVYIDGTVPTCCLDYEAEGKMGNVNHTRLEDIWRGIEYAMYRKSHIEGLKNELSPCNKCGYYSVWW
jgi:radical SAM protein with 4Fe4S-binding SPASM domain